MDGKPKMVPDRYLGTAAEIAAAMEAREAAALPERTRHLAFGDVSTAWGMLEGLQVTAIIDEVTGPRPAGLPLSHRNLLPGTGGAEPAGRPVLQARLRGLVEDRRRQPERPPDRRQRAGPPPVLARDARRHPRAAGGDQHADRGADSRGLAAWTARRLALDMTNVPAYSCRNPISVRARSSALIDTNASRSLAS